MAKNQDNLNISSAKDVIEKIKLILSGEHSYVISIIVYGVVTSLLTLAVPISVQSLVNTVTFSVYQWPLLVLSVVLLSVLIFSGILKGLQAYVVELLQRHFYARITANIAVRLLGANQSHFEKTNVVEMINRYFDVMTIHKKLASLLTTGVPLILQMFVGILLLAFYHPYFIVFDLLLIMFLYFVWYFWGENALKTSVLESKAKYKTASWLEDVARTHEYLQASTRIEEAFKRTDNKIENYLTYRKKHFKFLFIQIVSLLLIYALMSALLLGLGGYLVIVGQLSLGQLVAAEIVITLTLSNFAKSGKLLEDFYDLYASLDKVSIFFSLPVEERPPLDPTFENKITMNKVIAHKGKFPLKIDLEIIKGKNYYLRPDNHSSKRLFLKLLQAFEFPTKGGVMIDKHDISEINPTKLRDQISVLGQTCFFEGTIKDNLIFGIGQQSRAALNEVLELTDLTEVIEEFPEGIDTTLLPNGYPLSPSQCQRLEVARAILQKPAIIVIDEHFDQVEIERRSKIFNHLLGNECESTVILLSNLKINNCDFDFDFEGVISRDTISLKTSENEV